MLLGAGGMGEVYRARDTRLGRDVAIKILPRTVTGEPERRARFEREARMLASLNHPHIGAIYGVEDVDGAQALVLELVEGQTLAHRLQRGPVPVAEALAIARQIADALDAAHEKGIIHRDLKPANIKITADGVAKVLDFGLAKAAIDDRSMSGLAPSPRMTAGGTGEGVILGTPTYMSPEQARGLPVDKRTDVWAFGCVLYELLTGRVAFKGSDDHGHACSRPRAPAGVGCAACNHTGGGSTAPRALSRKGSQATVARHRRRTTGPGRCDRDHVIETFGVRPQTALRAR